MEIGYLGSGSLGFNTLLACKEYFRPSFIATDNKSTEICKYAVDNKIRLFKGNPRNGRLAIFLSNAKLNVIFSVNYLFIIEEDIINSADYAINIHGSLLPKYRGRTPHVWAIINNEKETGITAHFIDRYCDTGDIILQKKIDINSEDTGAVILEEFKKLYPELLIELLNKIKSNKITSLKQDENAATYFGKRNPEDGEINWNWQKERIKNWVRAQSYPYPGAYTWVNNKKLIIDSISFVDYGYNYTNINGLVLEVTPNIFIKTPNGVVNITSTRSNDVKIEKGNVLGYKK